MSVAVTASRRRRASQGGPDRVGDAFRTASERRVSAFRG
jgi:hypothetical protein